MAMDWIQIAKLDIVILGTATPESEAALVELRRHCPKARKADSLGKAASATTTSHIVTVTPDCRVDLAFLGIAVDGSLMGPRNVLAWPGRSVVHGLVGDTAAIACWPVDLVREPGLGALRSCPAGSISDSTGPVWLYQPLGFARLEHARTPRSAFLTALVAGFRLGRQGASPASLGRPADEPDAEALGRLLVWCCIGRHVENGLWSVYGARRGWRLAHELEALDDAAAAALWATEVAPAFTGDGAVCALSGWQWCPTVLDRACRDLSRGIRRQSGVRLVELDAGASRLFCRLQRPPASESLTRSGLALWQCADSAPVLARRQLEAAAGAGDARAMVALGRALETGHGGRRDLRRARALYREAAALETPEARAWLVANPPPPWHKRRRPRSTVVMEPRP